MTLPLVPVGDPDVQFNFDRIAAAVGSLNQYVNWISPTLSNSWVAYGGAYAPPQYMKDPTGRVYLRGAVKSGSTAGATIFTLPAGFRPQYTVSQPTIASGGTLCALEVDATGAVYAAVGGSTTYTALDGFSFRATQ